MIRQFQSTNERENEGRKKGFSGTLEADLQRAEAKTEALAHPDPRSPLVYQRNAEGSIVGVEQMEEDRPKNEEEGQARWRDAMEQRFLRGEDVEFPYQTVDNNEEYNDWGEETRRKQDEYFDEQEEEYVGEGRQEGQTGVQDY